MSIQNEIDRIIVAVEAAHTKVKEKGGTTAAPYLVGNLASAIDTIPNSEDLSAEVEEYAEHLDELETTIDTLPEAGGEAPEIALQEKSVTPTTSAQTVSPDSGYDGLSKVTVNAMPTATQATPSISVSSSGLITASATQSAGYVSAGTKSATKQLTTQAAQTITPGTSDKTIASGRYLTGTQTIKGDANLVAGNIKSGVSIFGVTGNHQGGEDVSAETEEYTDQLDELEAAINSLPDAGGGGAVETCTVTLAIDAPVADDFIAHYLNGNLELATASAGTLETVTFEVAKGTIAVLDTWSGDCTETGECTVLFKSYNGMAFVALGDCELTYNG